MKKFIRFISLVSVVMLLLSCFAACGGKTEKEKENVKKVEEAFVGGCATPEETAEKSILSVQKADISGLLEMIPDILIPPLAKALGLKDGATRKDITEAAALDTAGGPAGVEYTVNAVSTEYVKSADADQIKKSVCDELGIDTEELKSVSEFALVTVTVDAVFDGEEYKSDQTVTVAKINERWYFITNS